MDANARSYNRRIKLHVRILVDPVTSLSDMISNVLEVFDAAGILVEVGPIVRLTLTDFQDLRVGRCRAGQFTKHQKELFKGYREGIGADEIVVYFIRSTVPPSNGCAAHPPGLPGVVVVMHATEWTLAHEIGHVLGLVHTDDDTRLMFSGGTGAITENPPHLTQEEITVMCQSSLVHP